MSAIKAAAENYFEVWNYQDVPGLKQLFADDVQLTDWEISKSGKEDVGDANGGIFTAVPKIKIDIVNIFTDETAKVATCEILVNINDDDGTVLKVVDVITFTDDMKINAVRAYKC